MIRLTAMHHPSRIILIGMLISIFSACSFFTSYGRYAIRAERAFSSGDYDSAVEYCIKSLREKPSYVKAGELLDLIFPKAIEFHHMKIDRITRQGEEFRWDKIVHEYETLVDLVDMVENLNLSQTEVLLFRSDVRNYEQLLEAAKQNAAEAHYQAGIHLMEADDREMFKQAADHFKTAMKFIPSYLDSTDRYEICRQNAITRIAIISFENSSGTDKYGNVGEQVSNQLLSSLMNDPEMMEFTEFVTRDKIDLILDEQQLANSGLVSEKNSIEIGNILGVHRIITGSITHISATEPLHSRNRKRMEKSIVIGKESYTDDDGNELERDVYKLIHADAVFHEINAEAMVNVSYKILDVNTSRIIHSNNLSSTYKYNFEWVTYSGDTRALTFFAKLLAGVKEESPPSRSELVQRAVEKVSMKLVSDIKNTLE